MIARRATFGVIAAIIVLLHLLLPFRFPIPWPDETSFIAPAFELARHGTLFVWGMNPDRLVMWMPPGYFIVLAGLFKLFGYSFALVRWASAVCIVGAAALVGWMVQRLAVGRWALALHGFTLLAFTSPYVLMSANIGRMEALLALVMLASLLACAAELPVLGAAIVAFAGTIHFNAVYFTIPYAAWFAWRLVMWRSVTIRPVELAGVAVAGLALGAYALLVHANLAGFIEDIHYQLQLKRFFGRNDPWHPLWPLLAAGALCGVVLWRRRCVDTPAFVTLYGASFVLMATEGREIWYDMAPPLGFLLIAIALAAPSGTPASLSPRLSAIGMCACLACLLSTGHRSTPFLSPLLPTRAMLSHDLLPQRDIQRMQGTLAGLPRGSTVEFAWAGIQPFFLKALDRAGARWGVPQHSATNGVMDRRLDRRLQCDSPDTPDILWLFYPRQTHAGSKFGCDIHKL